MMRKIVLPLSLCLTGPLLFAQLAENLTIGFESYGAWYNDDKKTGPFYDSQNENSDEHIRFNNYLKLDYMFLENFTVSVQVESYEPFSLLNYSSNFKGTDMGTYSLNYRDSKLEVKAGYYYAQFGSGLLLRSWEDRQLGINNALFGGKVTYTPVNSVSLTALYGKQRVGFGLSEGEMYGFDTDLDLSDVFNYKHSNLILGFSYLGRKQAIKIKDPTFKELTNCFSGRVDLSQSNFYMGLEYVSKGEDNVVQVISKQNIFFDNLVKPGGALLLNAGFTKPGFGLDATFRRMENMGFYSDRLAAGNVYFENIVNYTPALTKQHDYLLTNIFVYQPQAAINFVDDAEVYKVGEIGGQLDLFFKIKKGTPLGGKYGTKVAVNAS